MGYYSDYYIEVQKGDLDLTDGDIEEKFFDGYDVYFDTKRNCFVIQSVTWYDHREDIQRLSLLHPELIFAVCRIGEGDKDTDKEMIWAHNGEVVAQAPRVRWPAPPFGAAPHPLQKGEDVG